MARSTRQQRRQRRAQAAGTPPLRPTPRSRPTTEEEPPKQPSEPSPERSDEVRSGMPGIRFLRESWAELNKVEWPNQQQLISGTAVVIIACLITGAYLYLNDQVWQWVVQHVFCAEVGGREDNDVPLVRDQHLFRAREQGEDQPRAPDRVDEPALALPARRRPHRAGDRDEGRPEGAGREAHAAGLRAREHGSQRRRLDGREEHARRDGLRRRRREAGAALAARGRPDPPHRRRLRHCGARRRSSSSSGSRSRSPPARSRTSTARSPTSTPTRRSSR